MYSNLEKEIIDKYKAGESIKSIINYVIRYLKRNKDLLMVDYSKINVFNCRRFVEHVIAQYLRDSSNLENICF